jgi:phenylalanyl-tRNA synthetase beta chain
VPIIDMPVDLLTGRIQAGRGSYSNDDVPRGPKLSVQELVDLLPKLGCEIEEVAAMQQYACRVCGKIYDRTEAQGAPLLCAHCGADYRANPADLSPMGANQVIRLNMLAVRPDIFDPGGMARYIRGYLGVQTGLAEYLPSAPRYRVQIDPQLAQEDSYRPFIACAVVRNVQLDHSTIKMVMNLQEDLHWALGRNRKLASIGVYDLDTLTGDVFHYDAVDPDSLRFVPLGYDPAQPDSAITPRQILERHKTGQAFAHLLKPLKKYPLLRDGGGTVLSMPPIINSESTRVTLATRQFFIDVTGLSQRTVDRALNIVVTSLKEILPQIVIESVVLERGDEARVTPDLRPAEFALSVRQAADTIGIEANAAEIGELLESMGHGVEEGPNADTLRVFVPAYRNDVMHVVDLIEDVAIAYGYDNLQPRLVPTFTVGAPRAIEEQSAIARRVLTGLGCHQVMTLVLTSEAATFDKWRLSPGNAVGDALRARAVRIENPISVEQTMCRVSLLPGLLETLAINKQYDLPQHLFEIGDCSYVDPAAETGAREERLAGVALIGTHVGYADIRAVADAFVHEMGRPVGDAVRVVPTEHPSYIPGRVAALVDAHGERLGTLGELHPEVLEAYGLKHPVAVLELSLARLVA